MTFKKNSKFIKMTKNTLSISFCILKSESLKLLKRKIWKTSTWSFMNGERSWNIKYTLKLKLTHLTSKKNVEKDIKEEVSAIRDQSEKSAGAHKIFIQHSIDLVYTKADSWCVNGMKEIFIVIYKRRKLIEISKALSRQEMFIWWDISWSCVMVKSWILITWQSSNQLIHAECWLI